MISVFNEYLALNEQGREIASEVDLLIREILDRHKDININELEHILVSNSTALCAERKLIRAMNMKRQAVFQKMLDA